MIAVLILVIALLPFWGCSDNSTSMKGSAPSDEGTKSEASSYTDDIDDNAEFSFIVCGDPQNNYRVFDRILEAAREVDFVLVAGDLTGSGTITEFENARSHLEVEGIDYHLVPGDHDLASNPVDIFESYLGSRHSSFQHENSFFVLFDNSDPLKGFDGEERDFVKGALDSRPKGTRHVFAVCHVPPGLPYSRNGQEGQSAGIEANNEIAPFLSAEGVRILFCGHLHGYSRYRSQGLDIIITGGAGAPLHLNDELGGYHHYIRVDVKGDDVSLEVVRV